jgi:hypothetical protein
MLMQLCAVSSCGVAGGGFLGEVARGAHHGHAQVGRDAHRDHVLRDLVAKAHPGIVAAGDDVDHPVFDDDFDLDVRVVRQEGFQLRPEHRIGRMLGRRNADGAGRLVAHIRERIDFGLDLVEARPECVPAAAGRRRSATRCASCASAAGCRVSPRGRGSYGSAPTATRPAAPRRG